MISIKYIAKRAIPTMVVGVTALSTCSCSTKKKQSSDTIEKMNINNPAYTLEQNDIAPYLYSVKTYDAIKAKNQPYEMKKVKKSYDIKCVPAEFKEYIDEKDITWDDLKNTVVNSKFDEYHKQLLLRGINNLQKNNFNIDLSIINYNLKNIEIEYVDSFEKDVLGVFDCFEHKISLLKNIDNKKKYENVFLHEMLGHGMTDAYIEESKVLCTIDTPTYVIDENNKYVGYSFCGNAFTEAMAQIICLTALDKDLCQEYMSGYDLNIVELLMLCKDNNCELDEYANFGVNSLVKKMKQNKVDNPYDIIAMASYNLEVSEINKKMEITSDTLMYNYLKERVSDELEAGKTLEELNNEMIDIFNCPTEYVILLENENNEQLTICCNDYINLTRLYNDIGSYAFEILNTSQNKTK